MKKQLFSLIVAIAASVTLTFGQTSQSLTGAVSLLAPNAITSLSADALHPVAGTPYTYTVNVPTPPGTKTYKWIVTQEQTFLTNGTLNIANAEASGGTFIAAAGAELNNTTATGIGEDIQITWKSFIHDPARPVFVVIYVENVDVCTTQNLKVYRIEPQNSFTLDIANVRNDGSVLAPGAPLENCVSGIVSATYDASGTGSIAYDFGTDYLYFTVVAANFTGSWTPTFQLTGATAAQVTTIEWAYQNTPTSWNSAATAVNAQASNGAIGSAGESIIVRVTVKHNNEEVLATQAFTLAVDGVSNTLPDLHYANGLADGFTNDVATNSLKPRPTISNSTTGGDFLPKK